MITVHGASITLEQLRSVKLERPAIAGQYWQGIRHYDLAQGIIGEVRSRGWKIEESRFALSKDEGDMAGAISLRIPDLEAPEGQSFALGFLTSNLMKRKLKIVVGTNVHVCQNGMATGELVLVKKHTIHFDIFKALPIAIDAYEEKAKAIPFMVEGLRRCELSHEQSEHILMEAGRSKLMPWSRIGQVDQEFRHPQFAEHGRDTSWALLQAFTSVVKQNPAMQQMDQMNGFRNLLPTFTIDN